MTGAQTFGGGEVPNLGANLAATIFYGLALFFHIAVGSWFKQWWFMSTWAIGLILEVSGYVSRVVGHYDPENASAYICQTAVLTVAPAFFMAGIYYQLGIFVRIYGRKYSLLGPKMTSYSFIGVDVFSIIIQGIGGGMAASAYQNDSSSNLGAGRNVMVAGLIIQVIGTTGFFVVLLWFYYRVFAQGVHKSHYSTSFEQDNGPIGQASALAVFGDAVPLNEASENFGEKSTRPIRISLAFPVAIFCSTVLIYIRSIYRVVELSQGWDGYLMYHEVYFLIFETLLVVLATLTLSIVHPGFIFGRRSPIPK